MTGGNPLALLSLRLESAKTLGCVAASGEPSATTARVEDAFARRIGSLDETGRRALLLAAISTTGELHMLGAALAVMHTELHAFDEAEDAG